MRTGTPPVDIPPPHRPCALVDSYPRGSLIVLVSLVVLLVVGDISSLQDGNFQLERAVVNWLVLLLLAAVSAVIPHGLRARRLWALRAVIGELAVLLLVAIGFGWWAVSSPESRETDGAAYASLGALSLAATLAVALGLAVRPSLHRAYSEPPGASWLADPVHDAVLRWWDGSRWTEWIV